MLANNLPTLDYIARGVRVEYTEGGVQVLATPRAGEQVAAIKLLADLGMGERVQMSEIRARLRSQIALIRSRESWSTDELLGALRAVWM